MKDDPVGNGVQGQDTFCVRRTRTPCQGGCQEGFKNDDGKGETDSGHVDTPTLMREGEIDLSHPYTLT